MISDFRKFAQAGSHGHNLVMAAIQPGSQSPDLS